MEVWTIKPLEWKDSFGARYASSRAVAAFHSLSIEEFDGYFAAYFGGDRIGRFSTMEAAKAAASQWYESRMKAGLVAVDVDQLAGGK